MKAKKQKADVIVLGSHSKNWLEKAVIGLNLCPFAKSVYIKNQVHYVASNTHDLQIFRQILIDELHALVESKPEQRDMTLIMATGCLQNFLDFNDFLDLADDVLEFLELDGIIQIASFHPEYQFADTEVDDITNYTNRAPYPTLHLLREESIDKAVEVFPDADVIFNNNMKTLQSLGHKGWNALNVGRTKK